MALTDILDKIQQEAQTSIERMKKEFDVKMDELKKEYETRRQQEVGAISKRASEKAEMMKNKISILGKMEAKNIVLNAKREALNEAKDALIKHLADSKDYGHYLEVMLKHVPKEESIHIVPAKGKAAETKKAVKAAGLPCKVNETEGHFVGGFIAKGSKTEIDARFSTIIETTAAEKIEEAFVSTLF